MKIEKKRDEKDIIKIVKRQASQGISKAYN